MSGEKKSITVGQSLSDIVGNDETDHLDDVEQEESVYVPKLHIRNKKKGDNLRALGARVPTWMIDDLKMLAEYHDTSVEDLVAGTLEKLLDENMDAVYKAKEAELRKLRKHKR